MKTIIKVLQNVFDFFEVHKRFFGICWLILIGLCIADGIYLWLTGEKTSYFSVVLLLIIWFDYKWKETFKK